MEHAVAIPVLWTHTTTTTENVRSTRWNLWKYQFVFRFTNLENVNKFIVATHLSLKLCFRLSNYRSSEAIESENSIGYMHETHTTEHRQWLRFFYFSFQNILFRCASKIQLTRITMCCYFWNTKRIRQKREEKKNCLSRILASHSCALIKCV